MDKMISNEFLYSHMPRAEEFLLNEIPDESALSYTFSGRFTRKMQALLKSSRRTPAVGRFVHRMKTAAAIVLIALTLIFGITMSVEAQRIRIFQLVTQTWKELTSVMVHSKETTGRDMLTFASPSYIPEGYTILEETGGQYKHSIVYADEKGAEIYYLQKLLTQSEFIFDTEDAETKEVAIGAYTGHLIKNKGVVQLYWHDSFYFYTLAGSLDEGELVKMAESIQE